jgi:hypothetical protein
MQNTLISGLTDDHCASQARLQQWIPRQARNDRVERGITGWVAMTGWIAAAEEIPAQGRDDRLDRDDRAEHGMTGASAGCQVG